MDITKRLENYLKSQKGAHLPAIRFFDGTQAFSTDIGNWQAPTLEQSLDLFLTYKGF